jgi:membrane associated rhomboid family serine protease
MGKLTWALILTNVIVFELVFSMPEALLKQTFDLFAFSSPHLFEIWRLFTSLFLHASASHLFFNMLGLYFFGRVLEREVNPKKFILIYFLSGIAGNLVYGFTSANLVVGASGCVFGLMGFAMLMKPKEMINFYVFPLPLGVVAVLYAVVETLLVYFGEAVSGIAHIAHIAGLIVGVLFAFRINKKRAGKGLLWLILFLVILILLGPILGLIIGAGNLILGAFDFVVGFFLYGLAKLLGLVLW